MRDPQGAPRQGGVEVVEVQGGLDAHRARELARRLRDEEDLLLAGPTETVYGIGGPVTRRRIDVLSAWKERDGRPFLLLVPGGEEGGECWDHPGLQGLVWSPLARRLARAFWPGPLTLALPDPDQRFPSGVRGPEGLVAVRRTPDPVMGPLVDELGMPVLSTSANRRGRPPARSGPDLLDLLAGAPVPEEEGGATCRWLALVAGPREGVPSTVVAPHEAGIRILRQGALSRARIDAALQESS